MESDAPKCRTCGMWIGLKMSCKICSSPKHSRMDRPVSKTWFSRGSLYLMTIKPPAFGTLLGCITGTVGGCKVGS